jgi:membrane-associated phospholipid phosphatase
MAVGRLAPVDRWTVAYAAFASLAILDRWPRRLPVPPVVSGRRDGARRTIALSVAAFYLCYVVFLVFPVAGPRYLFPPAETAATAVAPARLARLLEAGSAWGTAFPSSHVAVAVVASAIAWREWHRFGALLVTLAALLCLGTVYGQFHYAVDAVAGIAVAAAVLFFGRRLEK